MHAHKRKRIPQRPYSGPHRQLPFTPRQIVRRPRHIPPYWQLVQTFFTEDESTNIAQPKKTSASQSVLVLVALGILVYESRKNGVVYLYVPALLATKARRELEAFAAERSAPQPALVDAPTYNNAGSMFCFLAALVVWYAITADSLPQLEGLPGYKELVQRGKLDIWAVREEGQWFRCVTALTLHADSAHLMANIVMGGPFILLLGRYLGFGPALCVMVASGALGNAFAVAYRPAYFASLGFSTTLFGVIGALAALEGKKRYQGKKSLFVPFAAAVAFLALLGTEGAQTDVGAHVSGLVAGMLVGALVALLWPEKAPAWARILCGFIGTGIVLWAWHLALKAAL